VRAVSWGAAPARGAAGGERAGCAYLLPGCQRHCGSGRWLAAAVRHVLVRVCGYQNVPLNVGFVCGNYVGATGRGRAQAGGSPARSDCGRRRAWQNTRTGRRASRNCLVNANPTAYPSEQMVAGAPCHVAWQAGWWEPAGAEHLLWGARGEGDWGPSARFAVGLMLATKALTNLCAFTRCVLGDQEALCWGTPLGHAVCLEKAAC